MKLFIVLALAVTTASAFDLRENEIEPRNIEVPVKVPEGRIINGDDAVPGQFPYQVGLFLYKKWFNKYLCGGSLINNEWVLTSAHCVDRAEKAIVMLGSTMLNEAEVKYTIYKDNIFIHPKWDATEYKNNIALIKIPATAYSWLIRPVKLPRIAKSYSSYTGFDAIASGWGDTSDDKNFPAQTLQYVEVDIISNRACDKVYDESITSSNICASTKSGVSTCHGDSGGPLVLASNGVQVGIIFYGFGHSCEEGYPAVFTRVTSYLDWIEEYTGVSY